MTADIKQLCKAALKRSVNSAVRSLATDLLNALAGGGKSPKSGSRRKKKTAK